MDTHRFGMITLEINDDRAAVRSMSALAEGHPERHPGFAAWTPATFDVCSSKRMGASLDGESLAIESPPSEASAVSDLVRGKPEVSA
jgi:hypothetical protein